MCLPLDNELRCRRVNVFSLPRRKPIRSHAGPHGCPEGLKIEPRNRMAGHSNDGISITRTFRRRGLAQRKFSHRGGFGLRLFPNLLPAPLMKTLAFTPIFPQANRFILQAKPLFRPPGDLEASV